MGEREVAEVGNVAGGETGNNWKVDQGAARAARSNGKSEGERLCRPAPDEGSTRAQGNLKATEPFRSQDEEGRRREGRDR